ncbi:DUF6263 family protein [Clostridium grantii]|nr:DUF6263 family protein [Clostridium grantii]
MKFRYMIIMLIITIFIPACSMNKVDVKLKLKQGDMFQVEENFEKDIVNALEEITELNKIKKTVNYGVFLKTVDERKNLEFMVTMKSISASFTINGQESIQYSSEFNEIQDNKVSKVLSYLIDKTFVVYVRQDGKVDEVVGLDESIKDGIENIQFDSYEEKEKTSKLIYEEFGKDNFISKINNMNILYKDQGVKKGEKWTTEGEMKEIIDFDVKSEFKVVEISDETFKVDRKSEFTTNEQLSKKIINANAYEFDLKGKEEGELYLDKESGIIKSLTSSFSGEGIIKVTSNDANEGAIEYPINVKVKTNISVSK